MEALKKGPEDNTTRKTKSKMKKKSATPKAEGCPNKGLPEEQWTECPCHFPATPKPEQPKAWEEIAKFICDCEDVGGECPRKERVKSFIHKVEAEAAMRGSEENEKLWILGSKLSEHDEKIRQSAHKEIREWAEAWVKILDAVLATHGKPLTTTEDQGMRLAGVILSDLLQKLTQMEQ